MIRFILLLALLTAFPPLATDMYLAATPLLQELWNQPLTVVNLTLILFFVTYCFSLLFYGPLSDRFGRRPPLIGGIILFIAASFLCAAAPNIWILIGARILQALGAASASAISMAMAKDRLQSEQRERVLSQIAIIMALAPTLAPMVGSLIMEFLSWRWIFLTQAAMGAVALVGVIKTPESHQAQQGEGISALFKRYRSTFANFRLMGIILCNAVIGLPLFAFIGGSASIYISEYGLSERWFAVLFGANAVFFMAGSMTCLRYGKRIGTLNMITAGYLGISIGGIMILSGLINGYWGLALPMSLITFSLGLSRPPSNNLALEQVDRDAGTASSLMIFSYFMFGAMAMGAVSIPWQDKIRFIGWLAAASGFFSLILWLFLRGKISNSSRAALAPETETL